jgi:hypothetical protein
MILRGGRSNAAKSNGSSDAGKISSPLLIAVPLVIETLKSEMVFETYQRCPFGGIVFCLSFLLFACDPLMKSAVQCVGELKVSSQGRCRKSRTHCPLPSQRHFLLRNTIGETFDVMIVGVTRYNEMKGD